MGNSEVWIDTFKCDMREPYMGNTITVYTEIRRRRGKIIRVVVFTEEGIRIDSRLLSADEVKQLFKD